MAKDLNTEPQIPAHIPPQIPANHTAALNRYRRAADLAEGWQDSAPEVRLALAQRRDLPTETLAMLANDSQQSVRREIAANPRAPRDTDLKLAVDPDSETRRVLAEKIGRLLPELSASEAEAAFNKTVAVLDTLARDAMNIVRQTLAETISTLPTAPRSVVHRLARDSAEEVFTPILQFSPVLADEDLLDIIATPPSPKSLPPIAKRASLSAPVADALSNADTDGAAITALLGNGSAQIREETLDKLLARAPNHPEWHSKLAQRADLPQKAIKSLIQFCARETIEDLLRRGDLTRSMLAEVTAALDKRLTSHPITATPPAQSTPASPHDPLLRARALHANGKLDGDAIVAAALARDRAFAVAALAARCEYPVTRVEKILSSASAKGTVALCWRAGLTPEQSVRIQTHLAALPPHSVLRPADAYSWPLTRDDMEWQLDLLG